MILANKNGLLVATTLLRFTGTQFIVLNHGNKHPTKVSINDLKKRLFTDMDAALTWIDGGER